MKRLLEFSFFRSQPRGELWWRSCSYRLNKTDDDNHHEENYSDDDEWIFIFKDFQTPSLLADDDKLMLWNNFFDDQPLQLLMTSWMITLWWDKRSDFQWRSHPAAGGSLLGIGSDVGGSLRIPAHFSGVKILLAQTIVWLILTLSLLALIISTGDFSVWNNSLHNSSIDNLITKLHAIQMSCEISSDQFIPPWF